MLKALNTNIQILLEGGERMAKCTQCGSEVPTPQKEWDVGPKLHVKLYECPSCGKKFREYGK